MLELKSVSEDLEGRRRPAVREYRPGEAVHNGDKVYTVEERIAHGKFGAVLGCRDVWGNPLVLRSLRPFSRSYENVRERWAQQGAELQRALHPGLVHLYEAFEHSGVFHLVLERCDYRLDRFIVSPAWDGSRWFKAVARPVLCALEHIHQLGLTHLNLHPHNLFCAINLETSHPDALFTGAIKMDDLAVNSLLGRVDVLNARIPRWLVPPEYLNPSDLGPMDHRADLYQAGLLLLCVLQGRIVRYSFEEISTGLPARNAEQLESGYGEILARVLQPAVAERFNTALELWQALSGSRPAGEAAF
jgi:serine/threonine protein kinase